MRIKACQMVRSFAHTNSLEVLSSCCISFCESCSQNSSCSRQLCFAATVPIFPVAVTVPTPRIECTEPDCSTDAIGAHGKCGAHHYGTCGDPDCSNTAVGTHGKCGAHYYGTCSDCWGTCGDPDCPNTAVGAHGKCGAHRYGTCIAADCSYKARGKHGMCKRHLKAQRSKASTQMPEKKKKKPKKRKK